MSKPSIQSTPEKKTTVSAEASFEDFLDRHPCGAQIRRSVREQGLAQVDFQAHSPVPRSPRQRKPR